MAFERTVKMPNDKVCTWHEVTGITQLVDISTWVEVSSWESRSDREVDTPPVKTSILTGFTDGMSVADAEDIAKNSPEFVEWVDPTETLVDEIIAKVGDETAVSFFDAWESGKAYFLNDRASYSGGVYRCIQSHTSQSDWTPDAVPALWTRIKADPSGEPEEWVQPTGAQDAYNKGDRVRHNGQVWTSDVDANVWEPGVYGWTAD